jgi:hypothetical protein
MLPSSPRNFGWEQARCSDDFLLPLGRYADSEARHRVSQQRSSLSSCVDDLRSQSFVSTFCEQWDKYTTRWSRRKRCSSASSRSAHLEIRTNPSAPSCGWFHPLNNNYFYFKGENHEEAKSNVVDGSHRGGSGRSGISCSSRLLRVRGLLRFVFW